MIKKYLLVFIATLTLGSIADVPIMFLGVQGHISILFIFIIGFCTDLMSDFFWYWLGDKIGLERISKMKFFRQKPQILERVDRSIHKYGMPMLIAVKFVHGIGVPTQIMAGVHKYPKKKFLIANIFGSLIILSSIYALARIFTSVSIVEKYLSNAKIALAVFVILVIILDMFVSKPLRRIFSRQGSEKEQPLPPQTH